MNEVRKETGRNDMRMSTVVAGLQRKKYSLQTSHPVSRLGLIFCMFYKVTRYTNPNTYTTYKNSFHLISR